MLSWSEFYRSRVNSARYTKYFTEQYNSFLDMIEIQKQPVHEMGCGIGSVTRCLKFRNKLDKGLLTGGFDIDVNIVEYANQNTMSESFYIDDIFSHEVNPDLLYVSHGVLEHYEDKDIVEILKRYSNSIHYVPLMGWNKPSFGDERLLPFTHWKSLIPSNYAYVYRYFNDNKDVAFYVQKQ